jgi:hypothetical protein
MGILKGLLCCSIHAPENKVLSEGLLTLFRPLSPTKRHPSNMELWNPQTPVTIEDEFRATQAPEVIATTDLESLRQHLVSKVTSSWAEG